MQRIMCRSKIHRLTITQTELEYEGSITLDEDLIKAADLLSGERVDVLNLNNGSRIQTYVIRGEKGSGIVCLNGPAAHTAKAGDEVIVISYCVIDEKEAHSIKANLIYVDKKNKIQRKETKNL